MHGSGPGTRRQAALAAAALVVLVAAVYGRTLGPGFAWAFDDARFIAHNPHVVEPASWTAFLTDVRTTDPLSPTGIVRPLRTLSFAIDARLFGLEPRGFRLVSLLWFASGAVLLLGLLRALVGDLRAAFVGAALWALHPMQTEAAAWVSSRGDVACGALLFGAVWASLRPGKPAACVSVGLSLLAMGFKEAGVVAPLLVVLARCVRPPEGAPPGIVRTLVRSAPWFVASAAYLVYRSAVQVGETAHVATYVLGGSTAGTFATMFRAFGAYVLFAVLPVRPAVDWFLPASTSLADPSALAWLAFHATVLVAAFRALHRGSALAAGVLWFYAALLPVSNWPYYLGIPTAERFLHVPLAGFGMLAATVYVAASRCSRTAWHAAALAAAAFAGATYERTSVWRDDHSLWPATARSVDSPRAESYLAAELRKEGWALHRRNDPAARATIEESLRHAHRAIALWAEIEGTWRSRTHVVVEPHVNAANACWLLGRHGEALFHADAAIRIGESLFPQSHYNRALALLGLGRGAAAAQAIVRATEVGMTPDDEVRDILVRAAALCEADGEIEPARRALETATSFVGPGSGRARAAREAFEARRAGERARIDRETADGTPRALVARAIHLASGGDVGLADELVAEARRTPDGESALRAGRAYWVHARWAARATPEGWARAAEELAGADDAESRFVRARCLEELGRDDEAAAGFRRFLAAAGSDPASRDPRVGRARDAAARIEGLCPEFRDPTLPLRPSTD